MGDGTDAEILRMAGIEGTDVFIATTQGDNRNVMAGQVAKHIFKVPRVVCRIYDPLREEMYRSLGLETMSPTKLSVDVLAKIVLGKGG
jgi:trk system potassium uptake protein TrkA